MLTITEKNPTSIGYRERGGLDGIVVTTKQLCEFAEFLNEKYIDAYIPLPHLTPQEQKQLIIQIDESTSLENSLYWETETGSHGWCCNATGKVLQWG